jgi:hypothetical protein
MRDNLCMKSGRLLIGFSLLLLLSAVSWAGSPEVATTVIKIVVTNQFNKPVENAEVILDWVGGRQALKGWTKKKVHWEVHTNQEGLAHFPPVPEGTVQLQVNKKAYQTWGDKVDVVGAEKTVEVKLSPPQSQYSAHPALKPADAPKK